jgi:hypothetical protein
MPAERFTKKATSPRLKRQWRHVEESALDRGASRGSAIRQANAVVKHSSSRSKRRSRRS